MDILKSKTVIGSSGNSTVSTGGLSLAQIIKVSRQGEQKDYSGGLVALSDLDGTEWAYLSFVRRISFGTNFPFMGPEVIHIIYKVTT